jgi:hypothetical protein
LREERNSHSSPRDRHYGEKVKKNIPLDNLALNVL